MDNRTKTSIISIAYWFVIFWIPAVTLLTSFYQDFEMRFQFDYKSNDSSTEQFKRHAIASWNELKEPREIYLSQLGWYFYVYFSVQAMAMVDLSKGVEQNNFWKLRTWYGVQLGLIITGVAVSPLFLRLPNQIQLLYGLVVFINFLTAIIILSCMVVVKGFMNELESEDEKCKQNNKDLHVEPPFMSLDWAVNKFKGSRVNGKMQKLSNF